MANKTSHNGNHDLARYHRQIIFPGFGKDAQERLLASTAVIVGCGATGTALSNLLVRAGVGHVRIIDRDYIELNNLQRQILFDEDDIAANLPKAEAAARKLRRVNSDVSVEGVVADVNPGNVLNFLGDADVVLDGTDNFTTRFLLNDACLSLGKPWIYTGVIASYGMTATLIPDGAVAHLPGRQATGCLRCFLPELPAPGTTPTCDTAGVIGPGVALLTAVAGAEAMKVLSGQGQLNPGIIHMDVWSHDYEKFALARNPECPVCGQEHEYEYLNAQLGTTSATLCGRNAVQVAVTNANGARLDLAAIAKQLAPVAKQISRNDYLLRAQVDGYEFTVFPDSRAIIKGTEDEELAKGLYARYLGG